MFKNFIQTNQVVSMCNRSYFCTKTYDFTLKKTSHVNQAFGIRFYLKKRLYNF